MTDSNDADKLNFHGRGWLREMGVRFVSASGDRVEVEWEVEDKHRQPYGIVHGGVHCGVIESMCSVGAALAAAPRGQNVVGLENNTSFIRAVRSGTLRGEATPLTRGRKTHVWSATIRDEENRVVATGRVRLLCLDAEEALAGREVDSPARHQQKD